MNLKWRLTSERTVVGVGYFGPLDESLFNHPFGANPSEGFIEWYYTMPYSYSALDTGTGWKKNL
jgi:hypothetical protein